MTIRLALATVLLVGCVSGEDDAYDVTLHGDSKSDEIGGLRVRWELGSTHDWFTEANPELGVAVRIRGGTLILLDADVAALKPVRPDGQANFMATNVVTIGIDSLADNVELAFIIADSAKLAQGQLAPLSCGGTHMFKTLAFDFARAQLVVDGTKMLGFSACGISLDPRDATAFRAATFSLLAVPLRTTDGSMFAGVYKYKHEITVR